jgi:hypothetical protein
MTNTFIPTLKRQPPYCVWIATGKSRGHRLDRVWIDPELRSFVDVKIDAPIRATNDESEPEAPAESLPQEGLFAGQLSITPIRRREMQVKVCSAMKLSWDVFVCRARKNCPGPALKRTPVLGPLNALPGRCGHLLSKVWAV